MGEGGRGLLKINEGKNLMGFPGSLAYQYVMYTITCTCTWDFQIIGDFLMLGFYEIYGQFV